MVLFLCLYLFTSKLKMSVMETRKNQTEKIEVLYIKASQLERGMRVLNVGVVKNVDEYVNATVVHLVAGRLNNALKRVEYSVHEWVYVDARDGQPVIVELYF